MLNFSAKNDIILYSDERQLKVSVFVHVCVCVYSLHSTWQRDL